MDSRFVVFPAKQSCELQTEPAPEAGPGQIVTKTRVSLVSIGTESWCYRGEFDPDTSWASWVRFPFRPGYSNVGEVVQVGEGVERFRPGDRVFSFARHQEFAAHPADSPTLIRIPDEVSDEAAAWSKLATITQTGVRLGEHAMGDAAAVVGAGPIGQLVCQYLRVLGLREILVIDLAEPRLEIAAAHGATQTFCGSAADAQEFVKQHTDGRLADVVYDVTGHYAVLPLALKLVRNHGTLVLLGDSPHPSKQHLTQDVLARQVRIRGSHNENLPPQHAYWTFPKQAELFLTYVRRGQMRVDDLITHKVKPEDAPTLFADLQKDRGAALGVLFDWR